MKEKIIIFDTTLRDGAQSPGADMTEKEKIEIAKKLDEMGVDVIEAGFAASSGKDSSSIYEISKNTKNATICSLARCVKGDIQEAARALFPAISQGRGRIHVFLATSPEHMREKLKMSEEKVKETIHSGVSYARKFTPDVEFSAEDATRSDRKFLSECVSIAIDAGAKTINLPDTVGIMTPAEYARFVKDIREGSKAPENVIFSAHCHNDLGNATANSLSAVVDGGVRQIECSVNGLGERAGNAALEEIVMNIVRRNDIYPFEINTKPSYITMISKMVSESSGFSVQKNKAIVGENAFSHASGIHQDGMIKNSSTYEIISPESVGAKRRFIITGHSGKAAVLYELKEGINPNATIEEAMEILEEVKHKSSEHKVFTREMLQTMYQKRYGRKA